MFFFSSEIFHLMHFLFCFLTKLKTYKILWTAALICCHIKQSAIACEDQGKMMKVKKKMKQLCISFEQESPVRWIWNHIGMASFNTIHLCSAIISSHMQTQLALGGLVVNLISSFTRFLLGMRKCCVNAKQHWGEWMAQIHWLANGFPPTHVASAVNQAGKNDSYF